MSKLGVLIWRHIFESGDEKRLALQLQDTGDLHIIRDLAYISDNDPGHLFDIYELPELPDEAPVMINIHGGGLFAGYKEVNVNFNYEWARMGYRTVSLSYRRIPKTTLWHQIDDVMAALRFLKENAEKYHLNLNACFLSGDSAGALLSLFAMTLNSSPDVQNDFGIPGPSIPFRAAGLVSIMLDTQRTDLMMAIRNVVYARREKGKPYMKYILDPSLLLAEGEFPPLFLTTSEEDLIQKDTLKMNRLLDEKGFPHEMMNFRKGTDHELVHVFPVMYPMYPESKEVFRRMNEFFRRQIDV